jgi:predicted metalloprotease
VSRFSLAIQQMADKIFKSMSYSNTEDLFEAAYNVEKTLQTLEKPSLQLYGQEVVFEKGN